jgi:hypothetical protein
VAVQELVPRLHIQAAREQLIKGLSAVTTQVHQIIQAVAAVALVRLARTQQRQRAAMVATELLL